MRIVAFSEADGRHLGIVEGDAAPPGAGGPPGAGAPPGASAPVGDLRVADVTAADPTLPRSLVALLSGAGLRALDAARASAPRRPLAELWLLAPLARPPKFLAIGLNYRDHIAETGQAPPDHQLWFNKQSTCVVGPGAPIEVPRASEQVDYEGELGLVIGRRCRHVPASRAAEVVAGYLVVNDVSVRDWQRRGPTMTMGKSWDTHGPIGPWLVTGDEVGDPHALRIRTWVNDELRQDGTTADLIFDCWKMIEHLSTAFTLEPGDVISTGTPAGVGAARTPPAWLRPGDTVSVTVEGVGTLQNPVVAERDDRPTGLDPTPPTGSQMKDSTPHEEKLVSTMAGDGRTQHPPARRAAQVTPAGARLVPSRAGRHGRTGRRPDQPL